MKTNNLHNDLLNDLHKQLSNAIYTNEELDYIMGTQKITDIEKIKEIAKFQLGPLSPEKRRALDWSFSDNWRTRLKGLVLLQMSGSNVLSKLIHSIFSEISNPPEKDIYESSIDSRMSSPVSYCMKYSAPPPRISSHIQPYYAQPSYVRSEATFHAAAVRPQIGEPRVNEPELNPQIKGFDRLQIEGEPNVAAVQPQIGEPRANEPELGPQIEGLGELQIEGEPNEEETHTEQPGMATSSLIINHPFHNYDDLSNEAEPGRPQPSMDTSELEPGGQTLVTYLSSNERYDQEATLFPPGPPGGPPLD